MIFLFRKNFHLLFIFLALEIFVFFLNYSLNDLLSSTMWIILGFLPFLIYLIAVRTSFQVLEIKKKMSFFIFYNIILLFIVFQCLFLVKIITFHFIDTEFRKLKIDSLVQKELIKIKEIEDRKNVEVSYSKEEIQARIESQFSVGGLFRSALWRTMAFSILSLISVFMMLNIQDSTHFKDLPYG